MRRQNVQTLHFLLTNCSSIHFVLYPSRLFSPHWSAIIKRFPFKWMSHDFISGDKIWWSTVKYTVLPLCWEQGIGYTSCWSAICLSFLNSWKICVSERMCLCQCLLCVCPRPISECHWKLIGQRHLRGKGDVPADELLIATISLNNALLGWLCALYVTWDSNDVVYFCETAAIQPPCCMALLVWICTHGVTAGQTHRTVKKQRGLMWPSKMSSLIMSVKKIKEKKGSTWEEWKRIQNRWICSLSGVMLF